MGRTRGRLPPHMRLLLDALSDPSGCADRDDERWDVLVRTARSARLLGVLAARLDAAGCLRRVPAAPANHLRAALAEADYLRQMTLRQLAGVGEVLHPLGARLVALKGAAYILGDRRCARGRLPRDVDMMVERGRLDDVEKALLAAGWAFEKTDPYDQRYYREWSHELPPMRAPVMPLELDVHHAILPPLGRLRPDPRAMLQAAIPTGGRDWWTLNAVDQVLHAAAHLVQDSDCVGRLRDLVDIDSLCREAATADEGFWTGAIARAGELGLGGPLWYALDAARDWLGTPVPAGTEPALARLAPRWPGRSLVAPLARRCLAVVDPESEPGRWDRLAYRLMEFRALWLRMPPSLLAYHAASKLWRSAQTSRTDPTPA